MQYDREKMKQDLLNRTKSSYDRKEGDANSKYFITNSEAKFWRCNPTKTSPHIIDIIPFIAGNKWPTKTTDIKEGDWAYVLDLYIHSNVGPGKAMVVCPAKNYGNPCPICDEVEELGNQGVDWNDIPFAPHRRCAYNVLIMDDAKTEEEGIQVWEVSYSYSEKAIVSLARSPRGGGFIPFADPDKAIGRSIAFDVGSDTYKKITGHRFEMRDYDIPLDFLKKAHPLDQLIIIYDEEQLRKILFGSSGKRPENKEETGATEAEKSATESLRTPPAQGTSLRNRPREESTTDKCPSGAAFGADYGKYGDCEKCDQAQSCAETADRADAKAAEPKETPPAAPAGTKRTLLRRGGK